MRTKRQKIRVKRKGFEKKLLALNREERALDLRRYNLGWVDLSPPVMRGYKRYFVLREDVARSKEAPFYERLLEMINVTHYSDRKNFARKKRRKGRYKWVEPVQQVQYLSEGDVKRKKLTPKELAQFELARVVDKNGTFLYNKYVFKEKWRFVLRVRPNIIYRTRVRCAAMDQRLQEIDEMLTQRNWGIKVAKLKHGHYPWRSDFDLKRTRYKRQSVLAMLEQLKQEEF